MERTRSIARLLPLAALMASTLAVGAGGPASAAPSPDLVVSAVYGGGGNSGAPLNADYVELFNRGTAPRSLDGLSVQYASGGGTGAFGASGALVALPAVSVPPGGSFLVGMAPGSTGAPLPGPDATGTIAMGAGAGKVALVTGTTSLGCNGGSTPCDAAQLARVIDLVGYGVANFAEGTPAPAVAATTAATRVEGGCVDRDDNSIDFVAGAPAPRTAATSPQPCTGPPLPVASCPATLSTPAGTAISAGLSATDEDSAIVSITITSPPVAGISLTPTGTGAATLDVAATTAAGTFAVTVEFATDDVPAQTATCTIQVTVVAPPAVVPISAVQGRDAVSPKLNEGVIVEGVVTSTFTSRDDPDGFFVQDAGDGVAATSDGVFVFCRGACPTVAAGDLVRVTGRVTEFFGMTQVSSNVAGGRIETLSSGHALPAPTAVSLPATGSTKAPGTFESVEGMVVTFPGVLAVSEYFELARYGQLVLTAGGRPYQFTHDHAPSDVDHPAFLDELATRRIILDDDNNDQNDTISDGPDEPTPYPSPGLSTSNRVRGGDTITGLTGVMHWSFAGQGGTDAWRVRPVPGVDYTFTPTNPATDRPVAVGGSLRVASFNVLNYFVTLDTGGTPCGPTGGQECRGANSADELERQRDKIASAMDAIGADVLGLIELQNDDGAAVDDLMAELNTRTYADYTAIDTGPIGTDAIKVAFVYRTSRVTPVGPPAILTSVVDPDFLDTKNRPALIQTFRDNATGQRFTVAINHLKSKGSSCDDVGDPDVGDGQGNCSVTRTLAAQALADYLATDPTGSGDSDVIIMGDLNSYREEDPITTLIGNGYHDLIRRFAGERAYGYLFDGQLGYLDHALATTSLDAQATGATEWHINADEPVLFDYNDGVADAGEPSFERETTALPIYEPGPLRSSDHDPVVVGLDLDGFAVDEAAVVAAPRGGGTLALAARIAAPLVACPTLELTVQGTVAFSGPTTRVGRSTACLSWTSKGLLTVDLRTGQVAAVLALPRSFTLPGTPTLTFGVSVAGSRQAVDVPGRRTGPIWTAG